MCVSKPLRITFTRAGMLGPICNFIELSGGDPEHIFSLTNVPLGIINEPQQLIPFQDHLNILSTATTELHDDFFGAKLGKQLRTEYLGIYGSWLLSAETLREAIYRAEIGNASMLQTGSSIQLEIRDDMAHWKYRITEPINTGRKQNYLIVVSYMLSVLRHFCGDNWTPELIQIGEPPQGSRKELSLILESDLQYSGAGITIIFNKHLLNTHNSIRKENRVPSQNISGAPPVVPIPPPCDLVGAVREICSLALLEGLPQINWVAGKLGLSARSLQHRLLSMQIRFSTIVKSVIIRRSMELLAKPDETIINIALGLGYSDPAHFSRAFRSWTGISPMEARRAFGMRREHQQNKLLSSQA